MMSLNPTEVGHSSIEHSQFSLLQRTSSTRCMTPPSNTPFGAHRITLSPHRSPTNASAQLAPSIDSYHISSVAPPFNALSCFTLNQTKPSAIKKSNTTDFAQILFKETGFVHSQTKSPANLTSNSNQELSPSLIAQS